MTKRGQYGGGKVREGTVVSDKMEKTVLVAIEWNIRHRLYQKTIRRVKRLMAHDERNEAHLGDRVRVIESRPVSRHKRWRVVEVLVRAELPEVAPESIDLDLLGEVKRAEAPEEIAAPAAVEADEVSAPAPEAAAGVEEVETAEPAPEEAPAAEASPEVEAAEAEELAEAPEAAAAEEPAVEPAEATEPEEPAAAPDEAEARE
jgi:small subunit ribosomal protein S17